METVQPESVGFSAKGLERITEALRRWVDDRIAAGFVASIARHGEVAYFESAGSGDVEADSPMARDAIFRIYSMSKPVTAAAVLMLLEEGHFRLDDPIAEFIPEFAGTKVYAGETTDGMALADLDRPITIRHLLTHTSGLIYPAPTDDALSRANREVWAGIRQLSLAEWTSRIAAVPLAHQPGDRWSYGVSIDVLGRLVEVVSGRRFGAFLEERIFGPLGMVDTGFRVPDAKRARIATVYRRTDAGALERVDSPLASDHEAFESGGGGLYSTAADYCRFADMLLGAARPGGPRLLGRKTVELMAAPQSFQRGGLIRVSPKWTYSRGYAMALGVRTLVDVGEAGIPGSVGSFNWEGAASTAFWVDPKEDIVGILMYQRMPNSDRPNELFRALTYGALSG